MYAESEEGKRARKDRKEREGEGRRERCYDGHVRRLLRGGAAPFSTLSVLRPFPHVDPDLLQLVLQIIKSIRTSSAGDEYANWILRGRPPGEIPRVPDLVPC